jgi:peptide/nickel transport system substrate-binding protein
MRGNLHTQKVYSALACILVSILILGACAAPAKAPATPAASSGPKYGGTLRMAIPAKPISLDSFLSGSSSLASNAVLKTFGQPLLQWSGVGDRAAIVTPLLAKSWEISPDSLSYTFHLQEGVKWQNVPPLNGREFTADDFKYHLDRVNDPANKHQTRVTYDIKNVEVIDKYTLKVTTNQKSPGFLAYAAGGMVPYPKEVVEAPGGAAKNWVGTGAFILTSYDPDTKAIFKKNPDYWEKGKPYLDAVEFYFMPDAATRLAAFRSGDIDVLPSESKSNRDNVEKTVTGAQIQDGVSMVEQGLLVNVTRKPFDNKQVRQAIQYAIDYDGLIKAALDGAGTRTGYLAPWFSDWGAKQVADLPQRDVVKAKALLAAAGFPNGFKTTIMQNTSQMELSGNAVEPIVAMLKEVGIEATIVQADGVTFLSKWRSGDWDTTVFNCLTGRPYDPDNSLRQQWTTKANYNMAGYSNPEVDRLILAQQAAFPDQGKRKPIVKQILSILEDEVPAVPLYITTNYYVKQPWVKGLDQMADPQGNFAGHALPNVWIDKK